MHPHRRGFFFALTFAFLVWATLVHSPAHAASVFGDPQPGKHIYDHAGVLSTTDITDLEAHAAGVVKAGAPVIVFLQAQDATYDQTLQDAQNLMDAWNVQSSYGAHDGVVIFVNLMPGNLQHGQVALYAGQAQLNSPLPQSELQRIFNDDMLPDLKNHQIASALSAGLDAIATDIAGGGPGNGQDHQTFATIDPWALPLGSGPLAWIGWFLGASVLGHALWRRHAHPGSPEGATHHAEAQDLSPAVVGALVAGKVTDAQMEATILDLAQRGALRINTKGSSINSITLLNKTKLQVGYEQQLWQAIKSTARKSVNISFYDLHRVRRSWYPAKEALRQELRQQGWFTDDPLIAGRPLALCGLALALYTVVGEIVAIITGGGFGILLFVLLFAAIIAAFTISRRLPQTTAAGERVAATWRAYLVGVQDNIKHHAEVQRLPAALLFATAIGATDLLEQLLHEAGSQGTLPRWFSPVTSGDLSLPAAWAAYHAALTTNALTPDGASPSATHPYTHTWYGGGGFYGGGFGGGGFGGGAGAGGGGAGGGF